MGLGIIEMGIKAIMEGAGNSQKEAQRRAEEEARAAEQKRIAEERERQAEATKQRLLSELKGLDAPPQLTLMGIDSNHDLQLMTGDTPLLLNQGDPEHIARGKRYVDCDSTRKTYEMMSAGLPTQRDWMERTKTQLESATKERKEISKDQEEFLIKNTYDTARELMGRMDIVRNRIRTMKVDGMSLERRREWLETMNSWNENYDRIDAGTQSLMAGKDFGKEFPVVGKDVKTAALKFSKMLDESGIADEGAMELAKLLGPTGVIAYTATKFTLDAGFLGWTTYVNETELAQAQATYDTLRYQYDQAQEKVNNAKADLDEFCAGQTQTDGQIQLAK
jgi:hypothetical protein